MLNFNGGRKKGSAKLLERASDAMRARDWPEAALHRDTGFPARDAIVAFIRAQPGEVGTREIAREFGVKNADRAELKRILRELADQGTIEKRGKKIKEPAALPRHSWQRYTCWRWGHSASGARACVCGWRRAVVQARRAKKGDTPATSSTHPSGDQVNKTGLQLRHLADRVQQVHDPRGAVGGGDHLGDGEDLARSGG